MAARGVNTVITRSFSRPFHAVIGRPHCAATSRAYHTAKAEFTSLGPEGTLVSREVTIQVGDPGEAYVLIPTEVGDALRTGSCLANSSAPPKRPDRLTLSYFHDTQHFALSMFLLSDVLLLLISQPLDSSPGYPRLVIPQQLPPQSASKTSPATLYLYGIMHTIALDGTPDGTPSMLFHSHLVYADRRQRNSRNSLVL